MKKGIVIWFLIIAALVAVVVWSAPEQTVRPSCQHWFRVYENNGCGSGYCKDCGQVFPGVNHVFEQNGCIGETCRYCGYVKPGTAGRNHTYVIRFLSDGCKYAQVCAYCEKRDHIGEHYPITKIEGGKEIKACATCGKIISETKYKCEKHSYISEDCASGNFECTVCGMVLNGAKRGHVYNSKVTYIFEFARFFDSCDVCGKARILDKQFKIAIPLMQTLAVALTAFAFQYAVRKRKYMHISWLTVIVMWLTENACFGSFCPAVLWKKKLN